MGINEEKIEKLLEILQNMPFYQWENIKREIDRCYELEQKNNVPNAQLGTLNDNLKYWCYNLSKYKI